MPFSSNIVELIASAINLTLYFYALNTFLYNKRKQAPLFYVLAYTGFLILTFALEKILPNTMTTALGFIWMLGISFIFYENSPIKCILAPFIYNVFDLITIQPVFFLFQAVLGQNIMGPTQDNLLSRTMFLVVIYLLQFICLYLYRHLSNPVENNLSEWLIPTLVLASDFITALMCYSLLYYIEPINHSIGIYCCVICLFMFFCTGLLLFFLEKIKNQRMMKKTQELLELQLHHQKKEMLQFQKERQNIQAIRHDMKHYLHNYQLLLQNGDTDAVLSDIDTMIHERLISSDLVYTNNIPVNTIILAQKEICDANNIEFHASIIIPPDFNDIEILTALLNLIENAIEAEMKIADNSRKIVIKIALLPAGLSIVVSNHITESVLDSNPKLSTTKTQSKQHGYGLLNVRHIVEKKNGLIDIYEEKQMFCVHLLV